MIGWGMFAGKPHIFKVCCTAKHNGTTMEPSLRPRLLKNEPDQITIPHPYIQPWATTITNTYVFLYLPVSTFSHLVVWYPGEDSSVDLPSVKTSYFQLIVKYQEKLNMKCVEI